MTTIAVVNDVSWTFHNYGPLTATFTPAPSCSDTSHINFGTFDDDNFVALSYSVQCKTTAWPDCAPPSTVTPSPTTFPSDGDEDPWIASVGNYYSPGLYCPSGWETVGVAGRDGDKAYTTSGAMSYGTSHWIPDFDYMPTLLAKNLKPSETVALCCPRYVMHELDLLHILRPESAWYIGDADPITMASQPIPSVTVSPRSPHTYLHRYARCSMTLTVPLLSRHQCTPRTGPRPRRSLPARRLCTACQRGL